MAAPDEKTDKIEVGSPASKQSEPRMQTTPAGDRGGEYEKARYNGEDVLTPERSQSDEQDQDHEHEPGMSGKRAMSFVAMAFLWTASQIPVYLLGSVPPYIYRDVGGADRWIWFVLANLLSSAAICPFVGSLSDLLGRRYVAILGACFIILGMIIVATAHTMNTVICGMTFAGIGAGINELTALAATSEMAPTKRRGTYIAVLVFTILPFCPAVLWGQLIASRSRSSWRHCATFCAVWAAISLLLTILCYNPPPRPNARRLGTKKTIRQIDYIGGFLSISGMLLFMMGLQWGGYQYGWSSAHVLVPLIFGIILIVAFAYYEHMISKKPGIQAMIPRGITKGLPKNRKVFLLTLLITFISGANFFSILMFWPTQAFNVYGHDPIGVGIRGLPVGFGILAGACIALWALSAFHGRARLNMLVSSVLMTIGCGAMAISRPDNISQVWAPLFIASLGIGGIVVPASIIATIVTAEQFIATVTALTLSIRVIGGSVGYTTYYNIFAHKFASSATHYIGGAMIKGGIENRAVIEKAILLTSVSLLDQIGDLPGMTPALHRAVIAAGQIAYAEAYKYVYYASIAFGTICIIAAAFMPDISEFMDNHIAVVI